MSKILATFIGLFIGIGGVVSIGWFGAHLVQPTRIHCVFDRNELGPKGKYGQWFWEIYKCEDNTELRELVAGQRG